MVLYDEDQHTYDASFPHVVLAHTLRYPSPYAAHVLSSDVLSRDLSADGKTLRTVRLVLKSGKLPAWAPQQIVSRTTSWIVEVSELQLAPSFTDDSSSSSTTTHAEASSSSSASRHQRTNEYHTQTRNIDHRSIMDLCEWQRYQPSPANPERTLTSTTARVTSETFWPLGPRVERFGLNRHSKASVKSRIGLEYMIALTRDASRVDALLRSGPLRPYPFPTQVSGFTPPPPKLRRMSFGSGAAGDKADDRGGGGAGGDTASDGEASAPARSTDRASDETRLARWRRTWHSALTRARGGICAYTGYLCESESPPRR